MKKNRKFFIVFAVLLLFTLNPAFSQLKFNISDLQDSVDGFSTGLAKALPFNSTIGLNWSDAHIGKLIAVPPHFGIGAVLGLTTIKIDALDGITGMLGLDNLPLDLIPIGFPLPAFAVEARLGGIVLPFDIGLKFGYIPQDLLSGVFKGFGLKYQLMGADFRYALINPKVIPIRLSVGVGFNRLEGGISAKIGTGNLLEFEVEKGKNLTVPAPDVGLIWETNVIEAKVQVSFPLFIITPYAGAGAGYSWSKAGYQVKSKIKYGGQELSETVKDDLYSALEYLNISGINLDDDGFGSIVNINGWTARLYGGLSLNIAVIKIDITAMLNIMDFSFGASLGIRFQL